MSLGEYILRHVDSMNFGNINFNYQHIMILLTTIKSQFLNQVLPMNLFICLVATTTAYG